MEKAWGDAAKAENKQLSEWGQAEGQFNDGEKGKAVKSPTMKNVLLITHLVKTTQYFI